jgi:hypothetical protein
MAPACKPASMRFFRHTGPKAARALAFQPYGFEYGLEYLPVGG